jgi:hypothetical protein
LDTPPPPSGNKRTLLIVIAAVVVAFLGSLLCCLGGVGGVIFSVTSKEKTYYAECEQAETLEECDQCCKREGHHGYAFGEIVNEYGKRCGCL